MVMIPPPAPAEAKPDAEMAAPAEGGAPAAAADPSRAGARAPGGPVPRSLGGLRKRLVAH